MQKTISFRAGGNNNQCRRTFICRRSRLEQLKQWTSAGPAAKFYMRLGDNFREGCANISSLRGTFSFRYATSRLIENTLPSLVRSSSDTSLFLARNDTGFVVVHSLPHVFTFLCFISVIPS